MSTIIVAPFSNSSIRDWPVGNFAAMIRLLIEQSAGGEIVQVIGTRNQRLGGNDVVRGLPADRVINNCGRLSWGEVVAGLSTADCVIGNNSGICHLSGRLGTPTVCVFGGTHRRQEWRPKGARVILISRAVGCSPCQLDHNATSYYEKACLRDIAPQAVADAVRTAMSPTFVAGGQRAPQPAFAGSSVGV